MGKQFEACAKHGGKVRTKKVRGGFIRICKKGGKWTAGHVHHRS
jgi:hypothetical protein